MCGKECAQSGARVVITYYKNEQAANDVANDINNVVHLYQLDNSDPNSVEETFKAPGTTQKRLQESCRTTFFPFRVHLVAKLVAT